MTAKLAGRFAALVLAAVLPSLAAAADMDPYGYGGGQVSAGGPSYESVPAIAGPWNWTGAYIGATAGYGWGEANRSDITGAIGGVTAGINGQSGSFVFGAETDINLGSVDGRLEPRRYDMEWFGTVRGRVGYAFDRFVAYGTGGFAYGSGELSGRSNKDSSTHLGWTVGVGLEAAITGGLSAKVEYLYVDLERERYQLGGGVPVDLTANLVRFGLNYRF